MQCLRSQQMEGWTAAMTARKAQKLCVWLHSKHERLQEVPLIALVALELRLALLLLRTNKSRLRRSKLWAAVWSCFGLRLSQHALNLGLREPAPLVADADLAAFASGLLAGGDVKNAVCINVKRDLDLRDTPWCGWDAIEREHAEQVIVADGGSLSLEDAYQDAALVVGVRRELGNFPGWDCGVAGNEHGEGLITAFTTRQRIASRGCQPDRDWCHVQQQQVLHP
mmetsp:Transcript_79712/g.185076  ORF Transcript_79712/g.185076 Transcript_79712/m.185076 type:complete len:225 (+) Transcript_79712:334-1008(+)